MKPVLMLSLIIAVVMAAGIGSLVFFEVLPINQGMEYIIKSLAVIALLGASSAQIAFATRSKKTPEE